MTDVSCTVVVAALYRFAALPDFEAFREPLHQIMTDNNVRGTLLLAAEGINGTIAGSREGIDNVLSWLKHDPRFADLEAKESYVEKTPFFRTKVKLKRKSSPWALRALIPTIL